MASADGGDAAAAAAAAQENGNEQVNGGVTKKRTASDASSRLTMPGTMQGDTEDDGIRLGDVLHVRTTHPVHKNKTRVEAGKVMYFGPTKFAEGFWIGLRLDHPRGRNNGTVKGKTYFLCEEKHGVFVRPESIVRREQNEVVVMGGGSVAAGGAGGGAAGAGGASPKKMGGGGAKRRPPAVVSGAASSDAQRRKELAARVAEKYKGVSFRRSSGVGRSRSQDFIVSEKRASKPTTPRGSRLSASKRGAGTPSPRPTSMGGGGQQQQRRTRPLTGGSRKNSERLGGPSARTGKPDAENTRGGKRGGATARDGRTASKDGGGSGGGGGGSSKSGGSRRRRPSEMKPTSSLPMGETNVDKLRAAVDGGKRINETDRETGETRLHAVIRDSSRGWMDRMAQMRLVSVIQFLLANGLTPRLNLVAKRTGQTAAMLAAEAELWSVVEAFVVAGADISHKGTDGTRLSVWESCQRSPEGQFMLRDALDSEEHARKQRNEQAERAGQAPTVPRPARLSDGRVEGALFDAVAAGDLAYVRLLLEREGGSVEAKSERNEEPLLLAAARGNHWTVVEYLVGALANLNVKDRTGRTLDDYIANNAEGAQAVESGKVRRTLMSMERLSFLGPALQIHFDDDDSATEYSENGSTSHHDVSSKAGAEEEKTKKKKKNQQEKDEAEAKAKAKAAEEEAAEEAERQAAAAKAEAARSVHPSQAKQAAAHRAVEKELEERSAAAAAGVAPGPGPGARRAEQQQKRQQEQQKARDDNEDDEYPDAEPGPEFERSKSGRALVYRSADGKVQIADDDAETSVSEMPETAKPSSSKPAPSSSTPDKSTPAAAAAAETKGAAASAVARTPEKPSSGCCVVM